ncbi:mRNA-degrading endonuclease RelE of RelBE toxin-antitoxin system [Bacillus ectoiniformans]|uniref:hypothetical protein n=1 Tax=Bacillus ectoiniformans TaxID=1494429 RepID=UPI00195D3420|nr:hypothetical protein [Bacillus ectoiniformans]MBM7649948.1 mRNA-degrading endonuclease RelE of RelBE toxin-antitoxin system [Bacillus ectoiniformans]
MSISEKIIKDIEMLSEKERKQMLDKIKEKYMANDVILLSKSFDWWENEEDDIYNEQ